MKTTRRLVFEYLEPGDDGNRGERVFEFFIVLLIILNVVAIVLQSYHELDVEYRPYFELFEIFSVVVFSVEYVLRIWSCVESPKYENNWRGRLKFMRSGEAIIDLLAILPFYLSMMALDFRFFRGLRLFRLFRIFKLTRYVQAMTIINKVVFEKKEQLVLSVSFIVIMLIIVSSLMYYVESPYQPETFGSIPATMWWGIATLTTVGYGDVYPVTGLGKLLGGVIAILGVGMFALPAGIISSGFSEYLDEMKAKKEPVKCPHCGKEL
jgi:voltage-gated potassium channel